MIQRFLDSDSVLYEKDNLSAKRKQPKFKCSCPQEPGLFQKLGMKGKQTQLMYCKERCDSDTEQLEYKQFAESAGNSILSKTKTKTKSLFCVFFDSVHNSLTLTHLVLYRACPGLAMVVYFNPASHPDGVSYTLFHLNFRPQYRTYVGHLPPHGSRSA